jgi:hypothetical protein
MAKGNIAFREALFKCYAEQPYFHDIIKQEVMLHEYGNPITC